MNKKVVWKIESLWEKYFLTTLNKRLSDFQKVVSKNYDVDGRSNYYSEYLLVNTFDFKQTEKPVFSDDYGEYCGLQNQQLCMSDGKPIYLCDNHNKMLLPFLEYYESYTKSTPISILHIDAHADDAPFEAKKKKDISLVDLESFISQTRISDFFDALSETPIIARIQRVVDSQSFHYFEIPDEPYILSLDIDIFGDEGSFVDLETKVKVIAEAWLHADLVCIAMSPGFIHQNFAAEIIRIMTYK